MSSGPAPLFSLIVATYGRAEVLEHLVTSLAGQTLQDFEVIVVDQNQDDRVLPLIAPLADAGRLAAHLRLGAPNLSGARNAGLKIARGRIVAFPDDDCWYDPDTLATAARAFAASPGLDGIAARWDEASPEPGDDTVVITHEAMRRFRGGNVASITLFLAAESVRRAGGFDERIGVGRWYGAGEETDLIFSLLRDGARLERRAEVVVHHAVPPPTALPMARHFALERRRARGSGALYAKHRLPIWVIGRGIVAPLLTAPHRGIADGAAKCVGRIEGLARWHLNEGRTQATKPVGY